MIDPLDRPRAERPGASRALGAHLPLRAGMVRAAERAAAIGATALQIFIDNPTAWRRRAEPPAELDAFRRRLAELGLGPVAVHASYLVNLASPDATVFERSVDLLGRELESAPAFGAALVNVHTGSARSAAPADAVARLVEGLRLVLERTASHRPNARLVLENSAGSGDTLGSTVIELAQILEAAGNAGLNTDRIAFCLDTAHLWAAGYALDDTTATEALLEEFDVRIGLARLAMIHLNDSRSTRGSGLDRHQHLGAGSIGAAGLRHILTHPRLATVAYYLETPGMDEGYDAINMARARDLIAGRELAGLPPEAFALAGARSRAGTDPD